LWDGCKVSGLLANSGEVQYVRDDPIKLAAKY
jgi:hypothetical protein